jgi:predicted permease
VTIRALWSRLRALPRRRAIDAELAEEIRAHLALDSDERIAAGMSPADAQAAARREFGNPTLAREASRDRWTWPRLEELNTDVRFGVRMLRRNALSSGAAIVALGVAIGTTAAVVSLLASLLYHRYPYGEPDRLALVWAARATPPKYDEMQVSLPEVREWQRLARQATVAAFSWTQSLNVQTQETSERIPGSVVTSNFLSVLGVKPAWGRDFSTSDEQADTPPVAIITYDFWQRVLHGSAPALTQPLMIDRQRYAIVGVTPPGFAVPILQKIQILMPPQREPWARNRTSRSVVPIARLSPGASLSSLTAELEPLTKQWNAVDPRDAGHWTINAQGYAVSVRKFVQRILNGLLAMSVVVLVIACTNVAILLLARVPARRQELVVRLALGADRARLVAQMLAESMVLALGAGAIGILMAQPTLVLLSHLFTDALPFEWSPRVDGRVIVVALAITGLTCVGFGIAPALSVVRSANANGALGGGRTSGAREREWMRSLLLMVEVSLCLVLVAAGWLMLESARIVNQRAKSFDSSDLVTARIQLDTTRYSTASARLEFFERLNTRLAMHRELRDATLASNIPLGVTDGFANYVAAESGQPDTVIAGGTVIMATYFRALHIPILRGRALRDDERDPVVVVNEALAKRTWPGQDAVGKRLRVLSPMYADAEWVEPGDRVVVGVSRNVRGSPLVAADAWPTFFLPFSQQPTRQMTIAVRASSAAAATQAIRTEMRALDPALPMFGVRTIDELLDYWLSATRMNMILLDALAALGLALTLIGIYSVIALFVSQRTREIAIRMAVGASGFAVAMMIARRTLWPAVAGLIAGTALAAGLTRVISFMLNGISPLEPRAFVVANVGLIATVTIAALLPTRTAMRANPVEALRVE